MNEFKMKLKHEYKDFSIFHYLTANFFQVNPGKNPNLYNLTAQLLWDCKI